MSDTLDRKIAESLEPLASLPSLEWYEDGIVDESAYSPLGYWYTARHYEEGDILHWAPVNFKVPQHNLMLWKMLLDRYGWSDAFTAVLQAASSTKPGSLRDRIRCVELSELWEEAVRHVYADTAGLTVRERP